MVKNPPSDAGDVSSIPGRGVKISNASEQPSQHTTIRLPSFRAMLCNKRSPHTATKTQHSQKKSEHDNWIHEGKQNLNHTWYNFSFSALCCCLVAQSCPDSCDPMDYSLPGSSIPGISQARILEWIAISFSRGPSQPRNGTHVSCTGRWILYHWATRKFILRIGHLLESWVYPRTLVQQYHIWNAEEM